MRGSKGEDWWKQAVFYQIYPLSFCDSDGDGYGDLQGIISRLDYLSETLGVDALWLSPFYRSPMVDWGYDIADHTDVDPVFGALADFDQLVREVHGRDMRLIVDYVPNHTSDQHPWFQESRSSKDNPKRDWYVWRDPGPDGSPPNNWLSIFGGKAWTLESTTGQYYLHSFLKEQPDLNWRNPDVVDEMLAVIRFWLDRGADGLRIDVAHLMMKDPLERDNPPTPADYVNPLKDMAEFDTQIHLHDRGHEDIHEIHRRMRSVLDDYDHSPTSVTEIHEWDLERWARYYGDGLDELHMPFNFHLMVCEWNAVAIRETVESVMAAVPDGAWANWTLGNHDEQRLASRIGTQHERLAALLLLTLPGTPFIYYGDEIGMLDGSGGDHTKDPWGQHTPSLSRDVCRTPMQWTGDETAGFTTGTPWLTVGPRHLIRNVETELADPKSLLNLYRRILALRRSADSLRIGDYRTHELSSDRVYAYTRDDLLIVLNLSDDAVSVPVGPARVRLSTGTTEVTAVNRVLDIGSREGVVLSGATHPREIG